MEAPDKEHWAMVKRIVRYVVGTIQLGLKYKKGRRSSELSLLGYTASDHSGDLAPREIGCLQSATGTRQSQKNTRHSSLGLSFDGKQFFAECFLSGTRQRLCRVLNRLSANKSKGDGEDTETAALPSVFP